MVPEPVDRVRSLEDIARDIEFLKVDSQRKAIGMENLTTTVNDLGSQICKFQDNVQSEHTICGGASISFN